MQDNSVRILIYAVLILLGLILCCTFLYQMFSRKPKKAALGVYIAAVLLLFIGTILFVMYRSGVDKSSDIIYLALYILPHLCALMVFTIKYRQSDRKYKSSRNMAAQYRYAMDLLIAERTELENTLQKTLAGMDNKGAGDESAQGRELLEQLRRVRNVSMLEAIIHAKSRLSAENGIAFDVETGGSALLLDSIETVSLFGNILDNAIEACQASGAEKPYIKGKVVVSANIVSIDISNSKDPSVKVSTRSPGTTKKDAANHGYGTKQIASIVRSHNGTLTAEDNGAQFRLKIAMELEDQCRKAG